MSAKSKADQIDRLAKRFAKLKAAQRRKFLNEDIARLEKNGDVTYETVRTVGVRPDGTHVDCNGRPVRRPSEPSADNASVESEVNRNLPTDSTADASNSYTETPASPENGQQFAAPEGEPAPSADSASATQVPATAPLAERQQQPVSSSGPPSGGGISIHEGETSGQKTALPDDEAPQADPLEELMARALSRPRRGRPAAFDEHNKGKLVALLSLGMSLRQAAAVLGVSHGTIRNTLQADPALAEEINAARFQAQLQPLACVIREARRSWKAATWLLKYLDAKIASHEETPDERRQRQQRETDEFFGRSPRNVKQRKILGK